MNDFNIIDWILYGILLLKKYQFLLNVYLLYDIFGIYVGRPGAVLYTVGRQNIKSGGNLNLIDFCVVVNWTIKNSVTL